MDSEIEYARHVVPLAFMCEAHGLLHSHSGQPEGKEYFFDVTEHLREIQKGEENYGLIVIPTAEHGQGFGGSVMELLENARTLMIKLYIATNM
jgi:hypothetical protein